MLNVQRILGFVKSTFFKYLERTEMFINLLTISAAFIHCIVYHIHDEQIQFNSQATLFLKKIIIITFINDIFACFTIGYIKHNYFDGTYHTAKLYWDRKDFFFNLIIPISGLILNFTLISNINISGYYKTFLVMNFIYVIINSMKQVFTYNSLKFVCELLKLFESYLIVGMFQIVLTDPVLNNDNNTNNINLTELYLRFMESFVLILSYLMLCNYEENDKNSSAKPKLTSTPKKVISLNKIIGNSDLLRFSTIILLSHYAFPIINLLAHSYCYLVSLFTVTIAYMIIKYSSRQELFRAKIFTLILIALNFIIQAWAYIYAHDSK